MAILIRANQFDKPINNWTLAKEDEPENMTPQTAILKLTSGKHIKPQTLLLFATFTGLLRGLLEGLLFDRKNLDLPLFVENVPFYLLMFLGLQWILKFLGGLHNNHVNRVPAAALFLGLMPPLIDLAINGARLPSIHYGYYLQLFEQQTIPKSLWFFYMPQDQAPLGETIIVWSVICLTGFYAWLHRRSVVRTAMVLIGTYLFFILQSVFLPSILHALIKTAYYGQPGGDLGYHIPIAQLFLTLIIYASLRQFPLLYLLKRILHILPFVLIFLIGSTFSSSMNHLIGSFIAVLVIVFTAIVVQNDFFDREGDAKQGRRIVFNESDVSLFNGLAIAAMIFTAMQGLNAAAFLFIIFICGMLYNYPFYRAKGRPFATMKFEGITGAMSFLTGAVMTKMQVVSNEVLIYTFLVFGGWSLFSVLKDIKDLRHDRRSKLSSFYLKFLNAGVSLKTTHRVIFTLVSVLFLVPVAYFGFLQAWWSMAILLAGACLFAVNGVFFPNAAWFARVLGAANIYLLLFWVIRNTG